MKKALVLFSGGLDSLLAAKIILEQQVEVEGINFFTGFTGDTPHELKTKIPAKFHSDACANFAKQLDIKLHVVNVVEEFKPILQRPQHGYGAHLNPCLDCKLFMVNCAKKWMHKLGCDFLVSGEVLGQRPKSQRRNTMPIVAEHADDLLLRPLSAKLLPETKAEKQGWINREALYNINGRGRKMQIELANRLNIKDYPQPAGGCILTDKNYCARLKDLWRYKHEENKRSETNKNYTLEDIMLLKLGRHLRISPKLKLIIGHDESDNLALAQYQNLFPTMVTKGLPGALVILQISDNLNDFEQCDKLEKSDHELFKLAAQIAARFSKGKEKDNVTVKMQWPNGKIKLIDVTPLKVSEVSSSWYI